MAYLLLLLFHLDEQGQRSTGAIDRMLNYVIKVAARNACMDLWSRIRTCSGNHLVCFGCSYYLLLKNHGKCQQFRSYLNEAVTVT